MENIKSISDEANVYIEKFMKSMKINISKCEPTKEKRCSICGEITYFIENGYETTRDCKCMRNYRLSKRLERYEKLSIIDRDSSCDTFENAKFSDEKEKNFYKKAEIYASEFEKVIENNEGLLLVGSVGSGKTYFANCICNHIKNNSHSVLSFNLSGYFNTIRKKPEEEEKFLKAVKEVDLLFIDDLGSESINRKEGSLWAEEKLFNLFDARYRAKKPLIITTNLGDKNLKEHLKINGTDKIFSRVSEMCKPVIFNFEDKRKKKSFNYF